ncbi:MAG: HNH endonuclease [Chitinivibrionia bacterium]|nr:HNH endonuclease [Chitinivibrionia bacterium]
MNYSCTENESAVRAEARTEQRLLIQFLADEAFMKKYEQARSLLSQRLPDTSFASVFDALINEFLERHSPVQRKARRDTRKTLRKTALAKPHQAAARSAISNLRHAVHNHKTTSPNSPRHIPAAVRDEVFVRDKGRCTYMGKAGERCESTHALQIDHIVPFARGGPTTASNLRLLCAKHNRLAAEEVFGVAFTMRFQAGTLPPPQRECTIRLESICMGLSPKRSIKTIGRNWIVLKDFIQ